MVSTNRDPSVMQELEEEGGPGRGAAAVVIVIGVDNLRAPSPDETAIEEERRRKQYLSRVEIPNHNISSFPQIYSSVHTRNFVLSVGRRARRIGINKFNMSRVLFPHVAEELALATAATDSPFFPCYLT